MAVPDLEDAPVAGKGVERLVGAGMQDGISAIAGWNGAGGRPVATGARLALQLLLGEVHGRDCTTRTMMGTG
ncbi:hypothetical protein D3C72_1604310 [compost metagenome]